MPSRPRFSLRTRYFLLLLAVPFFAVVTGFSFILYTSFSSISTQSEQIETAAIPEIMRSQRSFVNLERLYFSIHNMVGTLNLARAHAAYIDASAIISEFIYDKEVKSTDARELLNQISLLWKQRLEQRDQVEALFDRFFRLNALAVSLDDHGLLNGQQARLELLHELLRGEADELEVSETSPFVSEYFLVCEGEESSSCTQLRQGALGFVKMLKDYQFSSAQLGQLLAKIDGNINLLKVELLEEEKDLITGSIKAIQSAVDSFMPVIFALFISLLAVLLVIALISHRAIIVPLQSIATTISQFSADKTSLLPKSFLFELQKIIDLLVLLFTDVNRRTSLSDEISRQNEEITRQNVEMSRKNAEITRENELITRENQKLLDLSYRDGLTKLLNRRAYELFRYEHSELVGPWALIMVDIDHFKKLNDSMGHQEGDRVLREVAILLSEKVRSSDFVFRYGGEEMLLLLKGLGLNEAVKKAESLCLCVEAAGLVNAGTGGPVTISCGLCHVGRDLRADFDASLRLADEALYEAKASGRNRAAVRSLRTASFT